MKKQKVIVTDEIGFHARTAAIFAKLAAKFESKINLGFKEKLVNGKSMLAIMTLGVKHKDTIEITAEGNDEQEAISSLVEIIEQNFKI